MHNGVVQIVDEVFLGSFKTDKSSKLKMTQTARAVGLALLLESLCHDHGADQQQPWLTCEQLLRNTTNAFKFMQQLLGQRARLQKTIRSYIDARAAIRECKSGTEEAMAAESKAMELLEVAASLSSPVIPNYASVLLTEDVLSTFHGARDKHIFRILATITDPIIQCRHGPVYLMN
jgi:hypothetical protein